MQAGFLKGHFKVNKTTHMFSNLAIDQTHDQHNAVVNDDGGAVGLTECSATLKRWMFRDQRSHVSLLTLKDESVAHCATARSAEYIYVRCDVIKISDWRIWQSISRNHCSSDILVLDTRDIVEKCVIDNVYRMESKGLYYNLYANSSCSDEKEQYKLTLNPHKRQRTAYCGLVASQKVTATFSLDCICMITSMIISLTRIHHVHHQCQPEGS